MGENRAAEAYWVGIGFFVVAAVLWWLTEPAVDGGPRRITVLRAWLAGRGQQLVAWLDDHLALMSLFHPVEEAGSAPRSAPFARNSGDETNSETAETPHGDAEKLRETLYLEAQAETVALLVHAKLIKLTDGVKVGCQAKSGEKYQDRSQRVKAALAALELAEQVEAGPLFPPTTDDERAWCAKHQVAGVPRGGIPKPPPKLATR